LESSLARAVVLLSQSRRLRYKDPAVILRLSDLVDSFGAYIHCDLPTLAPAAAPDRGS